MLSRTARGAVALVLVACGARSDLVATSERSPPRHGGIDAGPASDDAGPLPGPCVAGEPARTFASDQGNPDAIAVDGTHVYWTNNQSGEVMQVPRAGGVPQVISMGARPRGIALGGAFVYWTLNIGGEVRRAEKAVGGPGEVLSRRERSPEGIAVNRAAAFFVGGGAADDVVVRLDLESRERRIIARGNSPYGVAADERWVFWTNQSGDGPTPNGSIARVEAKGGEPVVLATRVASPQHITLDEDTVYFSSNDGVYAVPKAGGTVRKIASASLARGVALFGDEIFWADSLPGNVLRAPKTGGVATLVGPGWFVRGVAVDESCVYWASGGTSGTGSIMRAPRR